MKTKKERKIKEMFGMRIFKSGKNKPLTEMTKQEKKGNIDEPYYGIYPNCDCDFCNPD